MNQILEQILLKFSPIAYIRVRGVPWETGVKLDSIANNLDVEPGDQNIRVVTKSDKDKFMNLLRKSLK